MEKEPLHNMTEMKNGSSHAIDIDYVRMHEHLVTYQLEIHEGVNSTLPPIGVLEHQMCYLIAAGKTNLEISKDLHISYDITKLRLNKLFNTFQAETREDIVTQSYQEGIVNPDNLSGDFPSVSLTALSPRELEVYRYMTGPVSLTIGEIAELITLQEKSITHIAARIYSKLSVEGMIPLRLFEEKRKRENSYEPLEPLDLASLIKVRSENPRRKPKMKYKNQSITHRKVKIRIPQLVKTMSYTDEDEEEDEEESTSDAFTFQDRTPGPNSFLQKELNARAEQLLQQDSRNTEQAEYSNTYSPDEQKTVYELRSGKSDGTRYSWQEIAKTVGITVYDVKRLYLREVNQSKMDLT